MAENVRPLMTLESLRSVPLFASLDDEAASALRELLKLELSSAGSVLFRKGEPGGAMYLIEGGRVRIHIRDDDGDEVTLAELGGRRLLRRDVHPRRQAALGDRHRLGGRAPRGALARALSRLRQPHARRSRSRCSPPSPSVCARTDEMLRQRVTRNLNEVDEERRTFCRPHGRRRLGVRR